jgi:hypothetical protein
VDSRDSSIAGSGLIQTPAVSVFRSCHRKSAKVASYHRQIIAATGRHVGLA